MTINQVTSASAKAGYSSSAGIDWAGTIFAMIYAFQVFTGFQWTGYFAGEITEVAAFSAGPKLDMNYQYDPVMVASLKFENGAVGKLSTVLDADTPYIFNVRLFGTEGTVQNNRVYSKKHYPGSLDYWTFPTIEPSSGDVTHHPFVPEIAHFLDCIENNVESHASIHDSYKSMAVCFAIDESAKKNGTPVKVDYQVEAAPARA